jgi:hypothetical protein
VLVELLESDDSVLVLELLRLLKLEAVLVELLDADDAVLVELLDKLESDD